MSSTRIRVWWAQSNSYAIVAADDSDNSFTIAGDRTWHFIPGRLFTVTGNTNSGTYTVISSSYDSTNTIILVAAVGADTGAAGNLATTYQYFEFEMSRIRSVEDSVPQKYVVDRRGRKHRIMPAASATRCPQQIMLNILGVDRMTASSNRLSLRTWYEALVRQLDTRFYIYLYDDGQLSDGTAQVTKAYFSGHLDNGQNDFMGSDNEIENDISNIILEFHIDEDGVFANFEAQPDVMSQLTARTR